jgi:pSer/pThr/pTyr-binding forkhead associated (FHA) protein
MFALEITFGGAEPSHETVFVPMSVARIGARQDSRVVIDEMQGLGYELQVSRLLGRTFKVTPIVYGQNAGDVQFLEGTYDGSTVVNLGPVSMQITALDIDLLMKDAEASDRAGLRVLRQAASSAVPRFPALAINAPERILVSFAPDQPVVIGRARQCSLRLDKPSIAAKHARIGFESGQFWVEDLGSSTGTFVDKQQVSGRVVVSVGQRITLGEDVTVVGIVSDDQAGNSQSPNGAVSGVRPAVLEKRYPALVALAESVRPARIVLTPGSSCVLGRDQGSDMWLGVPHISRRHCVVDTSKVGAVRISDTSTNGTLVDGANLVKNSSLESGDKPLVLDFGGSVTVALCYNEEQEKAFIQSGGASSVFVRRASSEEGRSGAAAGRKRDRRTTTWIRDPEEFLDQSQDSRMILSEFRRLYRGLSASGRVVLGLAVVGTVALVTIIGALLASGMR